MIVDMILNHHPLSAVVALGLRTKKEIEPQFKCEGVHFISLGTRISSVLSSSVLRLPLPFFLEIK